MDPSRRSLKMLSYGYFPVCSLLLLAPAEGFCILEKAGKEITGGRGMKFVWISPGSFFMGSPPGEKGRGLDELQHKATLTKGFYMGACPVTQEQWELVMGNNPSQFKFK